MTITYQIIDEVAIIEVSLDGKVVGTIHKVGKGYQYRAGGLARNAGQVYTYLETCKRSIEI